MSNKQNKQENQTEHEAVFKVLLVGIQTERLPAGPGD